MRRRRVARYSDLGLSRRPDRRRTSTPDLVCGVDKTHTSYTFGQTGPVELGWVWDTYRKRWVCPWCASAGRVISQ